MLAREVLRLRGTLPNREAEWDVMVDLYFYRDPEAEENKDSSGVDEEKLPGADDVGPAAIDQGFAGNADWEVTGTGPGAAAFGAASNTATGGGGTSWEADGNTGAGGDWAASSGPVQTGNEGWNAETNKEGGTQW